MKLKEYKAFAVEKLRDNLRKLHPSAEQLARIWTRHKKLPYYYYYLKGFQRRVPPLEALLNFRPEPGWPSEVPWPLGSEASEPFITLSEGRFPSLISLPQPVHIPNAYRLEASQAYNYAKPLGKRFDPIFFTSNDLDFLEERLKVRLSQTGLKLLNEALLYRIPLDHIYLPERRKTCYDKTGTAGPAPNLGDKTQRG